MSGQPQNHQDTSYVSHRVRIREVVWEVVAQQAPDELQYLQGVAQIKDSAIVRRLERGGNRDKILGFGLDDVTVVVTAAVWLVLNQAAQRSANAAIDSVLKRLRILVRRLFRRSAVQEHVPALTTRQLESVWRSVMREAERRGAPGDKPRAIADAVVARLTVGSEASGRSAGSSDADSSETGG